MAIDKMMNICNWAEKLRDTPAYLLELKPYELQELLLYCRKNKERAEALASSANPPLRPQQVSHWEDANFVEQLVLAEIDDRSSSKSANSSRKPSTKIDESPRKEIRTHLKELSPPDALSILKSIMAQPNPAFLLLSRWNDNENRQREGSIDHRDYRLECNQIIKAIHELVDKLNSNELAGLERHDFDKAKRNTMTAPATGKKPPKISKKKIILFLSANPSGTAKLRLTEEYGRIQRELEGQRKFSVISKEQVNWQDINRAVTAKANRAGLYIVHFSGHGQESDPQYAAMLRELGQTSQDDTGVIVYDADKRQPKSITGGVWADFFESVKGKTCPKLQIVVFNNCFSESVAQTISEVGLYVVGVKNRVKEQVAHQFSSGFYMALSEDETLENAVSAGIRQARGEGLEKMEDIVLFFQGKPIPL